MNCSSNFQSIYDSDVCNNEINCFDGSDEICMSKNSLSELYQKGK